MAADGRMAAVPTLEDLLVNLQIALVNPADRAMNTAFERYATLGSAMVPLYLQVLGTDPRTAVRILSAQQMHALLKKSLVPRITKSFPADHRQKLVHALLMALHKEEESSVANLLAACIAQAAWAEYPARWKDMPANLCHFVTIACGQLKASLDAGAGAGVKPSPADYANSGLLKRSANALQEAQHLFEKNVNVEEGTTRYAKFAAAMLKQVVEPWYATCHVALSYAESALRLPNSTLVTEALAREIPTNTLNAMVTMTNLVLNCARYAAQRDVSELLPLCERLVRVGGRLLNVTAQACAAAEDAVPVLAMRPDGSCVTSATDFVDDCIRVHDECLGSLGAASTALFDGTALLVRERRVQLAGTHALRPLITWLATEVLAVGTRATTESGATTPVRLAPSSFVGCFLKTATDLVEAACDIGEAVRTCGFSGVSGVFTSSKRGGDSDAEVEDGGAARGRSGKRAAKPEWLDEAVRQLPAIKNTLLGPDTLQRWCAWLCERMFIVSPREMASLAGQPVNRDGAEEDAEDAAAEGRAPMAVQLLQPDGFDGYNIRECSHMFLLSLAADVEHCPALCTTLLSHVQSCDRALQVTAANPASKPEALLGAMLRLDAALQAVGTTAADAIAHNVLTPAGWAKWCNSSLLPILRWCAPELLAALEPSQRAPFDAIVSTISPLPPGGQLGIGAVLLAGRLLWMSGCCRQVMGAAAGDERSAAVAAAAAAAADPDDAWGGAVAGRSMPAPQLLVNWLRILLLAMNPNTWTDRLRAVAAAASSAATGGGAGAGAAAREVAERQTRAMRLLTEAVCTIATFRLEESITIAATERVRLTDPAFLSLLAHSVQAGVLGHSGFAAGDGRVVAGSSSALTAARKCFACLDSALAQAAPQEVAAALNHLITSLEEVWTVVSDRAAANRSLAGLGAMLLDLVLDRMTTVVGAMPCLRDTDAAIVSSAAQKVSNLCKLVRYAVDPRNDASITLRGNGLALWSALLECSPVYVPALHDLFPLTISLLQQEGRDAVEPVMALLTTYALRAGATLITPPSVPSAASAAAASAAVSGGGPPSGGFPDVVMKLLLMATSFQGLKMQLSSSSVVARAADTVIRKCGRPAVKLLGPLWGRLTVSIALTQAAALSASAAAELRQRMKGPGDIADDDDDDDDDDERAIVAAIGKKHFRAHKRDGVSDAADDDDAPWLRPPTAFQPASIAEHYLLLLARAVLVDPGAVTAALQVAGEQHASLLVRSGVVQGPSPAKDCAPLVQLMESWSKAESNTSAEMTTVPAMVATAFALHRTVQLRWATATATALRLDRPELQLMAGYPLMLALLDCWHQYSDELKLDPLVEGTLNPYCREEGERAPILRPISSEKAIDLLDEVGELIWDTALVAFAHTQFLVAAAFVQKSIYAAISVADAAVPAATARPLKLTAPPTADVEALLAQLTLISGPESIKAREMLLSLQTPQPEPVAPAALLAAAKAWAAAATFDPRDDRIGTCLGLLCEVQQAVLAFESIPDLSDSAISAATAASTAAAVASLSAAFGGVAGGAGGPSAAAAAALPAAPPVAPGGDRPTVLDRLPTYDNQLGVIELSSGRLLMNAVDGSGRDRSRRGGDARALVRRRLHASSDEEDDEDEGGMRRRILARGGAGAASDDDDDADDEDSDDDDEDEEEESEEDDDHVDNAVPPTWSRGKPPAHFTHRVIARGLTFSNVQLNAASVMEAPLVRDARQGLLQLRPELAFIRDVPGFARQHLQKLRDVIVGPEAFGQLVAPRILPVAAALLGLPR